MFPCQSRFYVKILITKLDVSIQKTPMTELIWEGKYKDEKKVTPVRIALPFQTIETVNDSNDEREKQQGEQ